MKKFAEKIRKAWLIHLGMAVNSGRIKMTTASHLYYQMCETLREESKRHEKEEREKTKARKDEMDTAKKSVAVKGDTHRRNVYRTGSGSIWRYD